MSKNRSRRQKKKQTKRKTSDRSSLSDHRRTGKILQPPLSTVPNLLMQSWVNERLPELLWAALLLKQFEREVTLELFRQVASRIHDLGDGDYFDIRHSGLLRWGAQSKEAIVEFVCQPNEARQALAPLLLFPRLPGREIWSECIGLDGTDAGWRILASTIAGLLDHQSQAATDLRWLVVICRVANGKVHLPTGREDLGKELLDYPNFGDQRKVRPTIRAMEIGFSTTPGQQRSTEWASHFWKHCEISTGCFPLAHRQETNIPKVGTTAEQVNSASDALVRHCHESRSTTAVDAKHDTVFGMSLYSLALLAELLRVSVSSSIGGRLVLRSLLEIYITLSYLTKKDDPELWQSFRVYGSGQAKLASLLLEGASEEPLSISTEDLKLISNEDVWEEFLEIDLGHWAGTNLRKLAIEANVKKEYDRYYSWTSAYVHGHWGSIRATMFDTCGNPLHRLHRIPRKASRPQRDVVADSAALVDKILTLVARYYPGFSERVAIAI